MNDIIKQFETPKPIDYDDFIIPPNFFEQPKKKVFVNSPNERGVHIFKSKFDVFTSGEYK